MARVHIATPTKNILETSEVGTPLYSGHFRWHQLCLHYRGSTVVPVELKHEGELGISTHPAESDTSMAAFNSNTTTRYMFVYSRHTHTLDW